WLCAWLLVAGGVGWGSSSLWAGATGGSAVGLFAASSVIFSGMVISYDRKYGPIGIVFGLMSFFIAIGVVITLGAAVGLMWHGRGLSFRAAVRKLRRAS